jgi:hypothetical protein
MTRYQIANFIWDEKMPGCVTDGQGRTYRCVSCGSLLLPGDGTMCPCCIRRAKPEARQAIRTAMVSRRLPTHDEFIEQGDQT